MAGPLSFDAYLGWVNITDPNNIPHDARIISADDLLRYEKLGVDTAEKFAEVEAGLAAVESDTVISTLIADPDSEVNFTVQGMVDSGVAGFQTTIDAVPGQVDAKLAADVPPAVASAIAADSTITAAAEVAVTDKVAGLDLITSDDTRIPVLEDQEGLSFAALDARGNRTRLEANDIDGGPTAHSLSLDGPALKAHMDFIDGADTRLPLEEDIPGVSLAFTDALGRPVWIQANDTDGGLTEYTRNIIAEALGVTVNTASYVVEGDSITQGGHGGGTPATWAEDLSTLLGQPVLNRGLSGTVALEIGIKQGGVVPVLTLTGGTLPATTTAVAATLENLPTDVGYWSGSGQPARTYTGTFDGIPATLTKAPDNTWTVQRLTAGAAYPATPRTPFLLTDLPPKNATRVLWPGRNDYPKSDMLDALDKMVHRTEVDGGKYLILSTLTRSGVGGTDADVLEVRANNKIVQEKYPHNYVNILDWLILHGVAAAGLTPTAEDTAATAAGGIPPSLMADSLHPNASGRKAIAIYVHQQLQNRNWA